MPKKYFCKQHGFDLSVFCEDSQFSILDNYLAPEVQVDRSYAVTGETVKFTCKNKVYIPDVEEARPTTSNKQSTPFTFKVPDTGVGGPNSNSLRTLHSSFESRDEDVDEGSGAEDINRNREEPNYVSEHYYSWIFNGQYIEKNSTENELLIKAINFNDSGSYICEIYARQHIISSDEYSFRVIRKWTSFLTLLVPGI